MAKRKAANVTGTLYEGEFQAYYECIGSGNCGLAQFYVEPPEDNDECVCLKNGGCTHPHAQRRALEALRDAITAELQHEED